MNSKANRQQLEWPPLLNLSKDRPHIDPSFRNVERLNAPFLNSMIQPLYREKMDHSAVYDYKGNEYRIEDNTLKRNGEDLFAVTNKKLVKTELDYGSDVLSVDSYGADICIVYSDGRVDVNGERIFDRLGSNRTVVSARCKWIAEKRLVIAIYYDWDDTERVRLLAYDHDVETAYDNPVHWYRQDLYGDTYQVRTIEVSNIDPCIHIGLVSGKALVSFTAYTGEVMSGSQVLYATYVAIEGNNWYQLSKISALNEGTIYLTDEYEVAGVLSEKRETKYNTRTVVTKDYSNYYVYSSSATNVTTLTKCNDIPAGYNFTQRAMSQWLYEVANPTTQTDKVEYHVLQFTEYTITESINFKSTYSSQYNFALDNVDFSVTGGLNLKLLAGTEQIPGRGTYRSTNPQQESVSVGFTLNYFQGQSIPEVRFNSATVAVYSDEDLKQTAQVGNDGLNLPVVLKWSQQIQPSVTSPVAAYSIVMDDNKLYSLILPFTEVTKWETYVFGGILPVQGEGINVTIDGQGTATASVNSTHEFLSLTNWSVRGACYVIDQGVYEVLYKFNNHTAALPGKLLTESESASSLFTEIYFNNEINRARYLPGTVRKSDWNNYSYIQYGDATIAGPAEDALTFHPGGMRVSLGNNFYLLHNTFTSGYAYIQGISYAEGDRWMGTLATPWQSIDEKVYIGRTANGIVYRNKDRKWYSLTVEDGNDLFTILEDRIIVVNTTSYKNAYDSEKKQWFHYASDYNGRTYHGKVDITSLPGTVTTTSGAKAFPYMRYTANGINPLYETMPRDLFVSLLLPIVARFRCWVGEEEAFGCTASDYAQGIDIFFSDYNTSLCLYRETIQGSSTYIKHTIQGLAYPGSTSTTASLSPNMFTKYINGAGNNDLVVEDYDAYTLTYYDNQPYLLYSASTQVSNLYNNVSAFFVLQGQFYGVIGDKLYSLAYNNGAIASMDAIIDLGDLQFIGNNPMISFWYDPATRVIRAFTGDANMETLYSATKIKKYTGSWYDETTQSLFAATDAGLLVFGPRNLYMLEEYKNTTNVQFSNDGITHITDSGITHNLAYYAIENYEPVPVEMETSFYGLGATESTSIDRWNITLYDLDGNHPESYIKVGVRSLTDISTESESKTYKITPDMYDKWSNSILIAYNPKLIKGQGIRLTVETPLTIQSIVPHIMDNNTGTVTKRSM